MLHRKLGNTGISVGKIALGTMYFGSETPEADAHTPWKEIFGNMLGENRQRSFLALTLMVGQTFFFNTVFFT